MQKRGKRGGFVNSILSKIMKRGLSTIVVTLIIILISLVAVGIIWVVVRNVIQTGTEQVALGQFTLDAKIKDVNTDNSSNNVTLTVRRNAGAGEFTKINFIFYDGRDSEVITEAVSLNQLEERRFILHLIKLNVSNLISISIVPVLNQNGKEIIGNVLDKYTVGSGQSSIIIPTGCTPSLGCAALNYECGTNWQNGSCGTTFNCEPPNCTSRYGAGYTCNSSGRCVFGTCTPLINNYCSIQNYVCGYWGNNTCSGNLSCGSCTNGNCNASGRCACNSGWGNCNNDNTCECNLSSSYCSGGSCVLNVSGSTCEAVGGRKCWYVDNVATGTNNGSNWTNAWRNFSSINWNSISPGDFVYISGGASSKTYTQTFTIGKSGTSGLPIIIKIGQDTGHNGQVIIDGGNIRGNGIISSGKSWINISGQVGSGNSSKIKVQNHINSGIEVYGTWTNVVLSYLEVNNNGDASNEHGIAVVAPFTTNLGFEIHHCSIHDNYQDAISALQGTGGEAVQFGSVKIYNNDIYNIRDDGLEAGLGGIDFYNNKIHDRMPAGPGTGHPDGIQFYNSYMRIYNNEFYNFVNGLDDSSNSAIYPDPFASDITLNLKYVYIYNNLIYETRVPFATEYYRGIALGLTESGVIGGHDIVIAGNTIVGIPFWSIQLTTLSSQDSSEIYNIRIENNVIKDGSRNGVGSVIFAFGKGDGSVTYGSEGDSVNIIVDHNSVYASSSAYNTNVAYNDVIMSYSQFKTNSGCQDHDVTNDPLLSSSYAPTSSSPLINQGVNLNTYFTTDKSGVVRGSTWDIGAYEYV